MGQAQDFAVFWEHYPKKIGKLAAEKAFTRVLKNGARLDELLAGIEAYKAHKPDYADYCHPATWLNQGRWMDEYDEQPSPNVRRALDAPQFNTDWRDECLREHGGKCEGLKHHLWTKRCKETA